MKSSPMVPLKEPSQSIKISWTINQESTKEQATLFWEDMPSKSLDGELKTAKAIGFAKTLGDLLGVKKDISELLSDNVESTLKLLQEKL